jgi:HD-GYP domain-containing protein (c-di-GMP phosphodiesterase class II)
MVSDSVDAMSTDCPYHKALLFEKVVSESTKYRGIQFDPHLVDAMINSVTIRRMVSDNDVLVEQVNTIEPDRRPNNRLALRSPKASGKASAPQ